MSQGGGRPLVLVHGAWVTAESWDTFRQPFDAAGYTVHTPTWPMLGGRSAGQLNENPPPGFGALTTGAIVDHLQAFIATLPEAPLLVGHSFGGLFTQMLLDRLTRFGELLLPIQQFCLNVVRLRMRRSELLHGIELRIGRVDVSRFEVARNQLRFQQLDE